MDPETCIECGDDLIYVVRAGSTSDKPVPYCQQCGYSGNSEESELVHNANEPGSSWGHHSGTVGEAAPAGYKYEKFQISKGRKKGKQIIEILSSHFSTSSALKKEISNQFAKMNGRNLEASAAAAFVLAVRNYHSEDSSRGVLTLRQVAGVAGLSLASLGRALKQLETPTTVTPSSGFITNIHSLIKTILPRFELFDPFTGKDVSKRVIDLAESVVELDQLRSKKSKDPNFFVIAACFVAWQSCFFYQQKYHENISLELKMKSVKMTTLDEFFSLTQFTTNKNWHRMVRSHVTLIHNELGQLLKKMSWINTLNLPLCKAVPKFLHDILEFQEHSLEVLSKEEELKRKEAPPDIPVSIPKKLTLEEEAVLNRPELTEKDLPEEELSNYIRSPAEVAVLSRWMSETKSK